MGFKHLVRDQEVDGSNPFAPTNLLESATYKMRKSIERLVQGQEVNGWNRFTPTILSSLKSMRYAAFSTSGLLRFYGQYGQHRRSWVDVAVFLWSLRLTTTGTQIVTRVHKP